MSEGLMRASSAAIIDYDTGEVVTANDLIVNLPENPGALATSQLVTACRRIFDNREQLIENASPETIDATVEAYRRAGAIERYVRTREHRDEARRAARVLETAVGEALGPAVQTIGPGRGKTVAPKQSFIAATDKFRFRRMANHRDLWWPALDEKALTRKEALRLIDDALQQNDGPSQTCTVDDLNALAASDKKFGCIYLDPPWRYDNQGTRAATGDHYKAGEENDKAGMTVEQIMALPVSELAADDAHLHLWTTNAFLFECPRLFDAWGFEFKSTFIWCKPTIGTGNYWRNAHEILLTAVRGDAKSFQDKSMRSWIECGRGRHSAKPEKVRENLMKASKGPYIELFARSQADGWTVWGNEIEANLFHNEASK